MKMWMTYWIVSAALLLGPGALAQEAFGGEPPVEVESISDLESFRDQVAERYPGVEDLPGVLLETAPGIPERAVTPPPPLVEETLARRLAIFAKNQTTKRYLDDEIDPMRDLISAELSGQGLIILDPSDMVAGFNRYKVTTNEERLGVIDGLFTGGSAVRIGQMIGADYILLMKLTRADTRQRGNITTHELTVSMSVLETAEGTSVDGRNFNERYPVNTAYGSADEMTYFHDLAEQAARKIGAYASSKSASWRVPDPIDTRLVSFSVRTTIDALIDGLENGVRAPNELLDEMRRIVGGVTVELNGVALGSSPGTFKAMPGLHQLRVTRQWMEPWQRTVQIQEGAAFNIGLELSSEGLAKFITEEGFRAAVALTYAEAAYRKDIRINFDTEQWRDVVTGRAVDGIILERSTVE